ncbi:L-2-hydroxyglutarate dehydrogenase, mitochondrial-like [Trichogramma pretiosum]|uniref:L-2-hydroxyglutarate dehydrogenase, mitochondrial-like n=1 Tax=Trichogramma pretiosum TaxID=7493 RepID=UPI0006C971C0|nr:L-2-hydroxyglutarate dehydrogenase, mitochondrial-like [Trichogramma pretiosum]
MTKLRVQVLVYVNINRLAYDLTIVGGGIIGCATAREMKCRHPELQIAIVEKEDGIAKHQTSHNSGVIFTGLFYKSDCVKAKMCSDSMKQVYEYLCKNDIPHKKSGKLVVAQTDDDICELNELYESGLENKCPDIQLVERECIANFEPKCKGKKALWCPWTGNVDWSTVCHRFARDFKEMGGVIHENFKVAGFAEAIESKGTRELHPLCVHSKNQYMHTKYVLTCAGLFSDQLARMSDCPPYPKVIPMRSEYLKLRESRQCLVQTNLYSLSKTTKYPFWSLHFNQGVNGEVFLGPNAVFAMSREGYAWRDVDLQHCSSLVACPGYHRFWTKNFVVGVNQFARSLVPRLSVNEAKRYIPALTPDDVARGPTGVSAIVVDRDGYALDDFVFDNGPGRIGQRILHLRNVPSPGASGCMAIAKFLADKMEKEFKF